MGLASAALHVHRRHVALDQIARHHDRPVDELPRGLAQILALLNVLDVAFHVLGGPAEAVRNVGEWRKHEAELGKEAEQLTRHRLHVVLATGDDERAHLVANQDLVAQRREGY